MCTVSNIGDQWTYPWQPQNPQPKYPEVKTYFVEDKVSKERLEKIAKENKKLAEEIKELKKEMASLKKLLEAAKIYDEETGQKDCEMEEKIALIKKLAELTGVNFDDIFKNGNES